MSALVDTLAAVSPEKSKTNPLGAGRNPRAGEAATASLTVRLTSTERASYQDAAIAAGMKLGDWVRAACEAQLPKRKKGRT